MTHIFNWLYGAAGVVFLFGAAIFVHEFGHYWVARKRGLKIEGFAIGFGPKIFSWVRDGIEYSVRWIPAGGFVKLPQMVTSSALEGATGESIPPAPPLSKILVAVAGPLMNVAFAFVIAVIIYWVGLPVPINPSIIGYVEPSSPEARMGIREGDRIIAVSDKPVKSWEEIYQATILALSNTLPVTIVHEAPNHPAVTNTYFLKAQVNTLLGLKTLNLDARDHLIIDTVSGGEPAAAAGIKVDDEVIGFAGAPITSRQQLINLIQKRGGLPTPIIVKRGQQRLALTVTPFLDPKTKKCMIGVGFTLGLDRYELEHPTPMAQIEEVLDQVYGTITALAHSHESGVKASDLSGPVGIISALAFQLNTDYRLALHFLVMLNINLAIINLLPLPILDGGHIAVALIERVRRRPLSGRVLENTYTVFAIVLISFMLYVTFFDIKRISLFRMVFHRDTQIEQPEKPATLQPPADKAP